MQFAIWLIALMCQLSALVRVTVQHRLHPKQEAFIKQLSSYEITSPLRVNDFGESFPHTLHYRRRRRSLNDDLSAALRVHYRIDAFGQRFHLNLSAHSDFIAPAYTVTHLGADRSDSTAAGGEEKEADMRHCFFRGHVNSSGEQPAVVSLCTGLIGTFTTPDGEYFLEPLLSAEGEEYDDEHHKPHLVYRHERKRNTWSTSDASQAEPCLASDASKRLVSSEARGNMGEELDSLRAAIDDRGDMSHSNATQPRPPRRRKRFLSYPRYVELMVTADAKMAQHHGRNLEHYILTIMSVVAAVYRDPSVGNLINIMIVKLLVIHDEQQGPAVSFNAATTLHNFCTWQQKQNVQDDSHPSHHDTALLITREDICRAKDKCDTLGLAELGTMCDQYRSCSISEENGISASFTIAHELGHVFNMPHDDNPKCREAGMKHQYHVMAPTLNYDTNPWSWSKCSRKYITEFLDTGYGECLLDEPVGRTYELPSLLPGQIYNANRQCELMFGPGSQICPYMKQCKRLWCTSAEGDHKGCRTQHMPLADGTECGHGMYCRHGMCVNKELYLQPVDGEWGPWGAYSACSRSCGGGTRSTTRECNKPEPRNGGKFCVGRRMKFRSCNTEPCPRGRKDFREEQCSQFDGKHFNINGLPPNVRWVPKYSGILLKDRCKLFCRVAGATAYYPLKDRVIDGTPCGTDTYDICVQGLCRQAGCDHVLNSKARNDKCGVCGGDNSSCKTLAGTFNDAQYGYNTVVRIPAGATNIDIKQVSYSGKPEDDNYLALSDSQSNFLLNGNFVVAMFKREITFKGTVIEYSGSDTKVERINCTERIEEELVLQVLCVGNLYNPDVRYSFNIPIEEHREEFVWAPSSSWLECNRICQGERRQKTQCVRKSDHVEVSEQRCEHLPHPAAVTEPCNTDCEVRWHVTGKSDCSAKCGPGYRSLEVQCMKYNLMQSHPMEASTCADIAKPATRESCHGDCLLKSWQYGAWSQCSKTCGRGSRSRESYCMSNLGRRLVDRECDEYQRVVMEVCNEQPCPTWNAGDWSECQVTCGKGVRHRQVWCTGANTEEKLSAQLCNPSGKPASVGTCELPECASWQAGVWGTCAVTCGHGYQMRAVRCVSADYGNTVNDRECNAAARPRDSQDCEMPACPWASPVQSTPRPDNSDQLLTQWRYGSWTACSATCGKGKRARYVSCRDAQGGVADESYCAHLPRPPETATCFSPCGQWRTGEWSPCSVTCGAGRSTRQVLCSNYHQPVDQSFCDPDERPATEQECSAAPCSVSRRLRINDQPYGYPKDPGRHPGHNSWNVPSTDNQWRTGPWGACSSTCAGGFHRRVVVCQDADGRSNSFCDERVKPAESKSCNSGPCPLWNYGVWAQCTQSCGGGRRTRLVVCQRPSGERLSDYNCDVLDKPPDTERCNLQPCPGSASWHRRPWKPCSVTCGHGTKQREITCVDHKNQSKLEEQHCRHLPRPRTQKPCRGRGCPTWKANRWSECSVTCGVGLQSRDVYCRIKGSGKVREDLCDTSSRPADVQRCQTAECTRYTWISAPWKACNATCGAGVRNREVNCADPGMTIVQADYCEPSLRPASHQPCEEAPCHYVWATWEWSQCSASCGVGYQLRVVSCSKMHTSQAPPLYSAQSPTAATRCPDPRPPSSRPCLLKDCPQESYWKVGPWSKCSQTCGAGVLERIVECVTSKGQASKHCHPLEMPDSQAACQDRECQSFTSCREVQMRQGVRMDGEYYLKVRSRTLQIYCAQMETDFPKEYVTLRSGQTDNYSEVYGYRLLNPFECPDNGSRRQDCSCRKDYASAGYTLFHKIRLDLSTLRILTTDLRFSHTPVGRPVPFATAGDCYSAAKCPQGQFSINLIGTGLRVAEATKWTSQGNYVTFKVHRSEDGRRIYGRCGGFCGKCVPQAHNGLLLQVH
ncbi:A disintegrin and metalloproteinase with thrombospondin motifs 20-like isoform X1 [Dunckerocampus dactyliophorus]|uniref:A disintegrin and metalloproteinase with thrombospondin motifs 20-like isoform X1 n=2 Tax=Dunckerocampus dactyliophorus TaxID=161453 RepID=UPI002405D6CB|nr:A disintegrin and metalloproteinase with thrombospondin motifs 20-like isoform X1 [Dunckerocampus dactyliophorus]